MGDGKSYNRAAKQELLYNVYLSSPEVYKLHILIKHSNKLYTVNSEIFARTLFSRNLAYAKFRKNKTLAKWQNHSVVY